MRHHRRYLKSPPIFSKICQFIPILTHSASPGIWVCLFCGYFGCGRFQQSHALAHHRKTQVLFNLSLVPFAWLRSSKHPVVLEVNERAVHCYLCKCYVLNDNKRCEIYQASLDLVISFFLGAGLLLSAGCLSRYKRNHFLRLWQGIDSL